MNDETKQDLEEFKLVLQNLADDFDAFSAIYPRIEKILGLLNELPSKNPEKDGRAGLFVFILMASQCKDALEWFQQEVGRKTNLINKKESHDLYKKNALRSTDLS